MARQNPLPALAIPVIAGAVGKFAEAGKLPPEAYARAPQPTREKRSKDTLDNDGARVVGGHTYRELNDFLGNRTSRAVGNNTRAVRRNAQTIAIQLHRTDIVTFFANGDVRFDAGGYRTVTTKARMNSYARPLGASIYADRGQWWFATSAGRQPFVDGISIATGGGAARVQAPAHAKTPPRAAARPGPVTVPGVRAVTSTPGRYRGRQMEMFNPRRKVPVVSGIRDTELSVWEERDRTFIGLVSKLPAPHGTPIGEWWDDDARQMFEDGFFNARRLHESVYEYAVDVGLVEEKGRKSNPASDWTCPGCKRYLSFSAAYFATCKHCKASFPRGDGAQPPKSMDDVFGPKSWRDAMRARGYTVHEPTERSRANPVSLSAAVHAKIGKLARDIGDGKITMRDALDLAQTYAKGAPLASLRDLIGSYMTWPHEPVKVARENPSLMLVTGNPGQNRGAIERAWCEFHQQREFTGTIRSLGDIRGVPSMLFALGRLHAIDFGQGDCTMSGNGVWVCANASGKLFLVSERHPMDLSKLSGSTIRAVTYDPMRSSGKEQALYKHDFKRPLPSLSPIGDSKRCRAALLDGGGYAVKDWIYS